MINKILYFWTRDVEYQSDTKEREMMRKRTNAHSFGTLIILIDDE